MDVAILKIDSLRFILPGLVRKEKSIDTILDIDRGNYSSAAEILEVIRKEVGDYCIDKKLTHSHDNIRANVFLPTTNHDFKGHTFVLKMPPTLMKNMRRTQEHDISYCLGQGATGNVFETGSPEFSRKRDHRLPSYLAEKVEPSLTWWTTFPIKNKNGNVLGVINIDGINFDLPKEEEININNIVLRYLKEMGEALDSQPKKDIFIIIKKI